MAATHDWKVCNSDGEYVASFKHPSDAAAFVAILGEGATIRNKHARSTVIWKEGTDGSAGESYDLVAERCFAKVREIAKKAADRRLAAIQNHAARYGSV